MGTPGAKAQFLLFQVFTRLKPSAPAGMQLSVQSFSTPKLVEQIGILHYRQDHGGRAQISRARRPASTRAVSSQMAKGRLFPGSRPFSVGAKPNGLNGSTLSRYAISGRFFDWRWLA